VTRTGRPRERQALALAAVAFLCAAVAALVPAKLQRATYTWPPRSLPASAHPDRGWYSPLLLARHEPESMSARLPCSPPPPLPHAPRPAVALATARDPGSAGGLAVTENGREFVVAVGRTTLTRVPIQGGCPYRLSIAGERWSLSGTGLSRNGTAPMPVVSGLFSNLDLRRSAAPSVSVTTTVYASQSTVVQTVLRIFAAVCAIAALALVAAPRRLGRPRLPGVGLVDAVVVAVLLVWWPLGPSFFDDGWVTAGQTNFAVGGGPSSYYDSFAVTSSLQYWLVWIEHPLFAASHALVVLRIPALICLLATWIVCRWTLGRVAPAAGTAARWALATAFLTGALAWGMTLRPEPVVALLVTGATACTVRFLERGTPGPLAVAVVLVALAVSAHPAGLLTIAPLLVALPALARWARPRFAVVGTILLSGAALLAILALLGSDVGHLSTNVASLRAFGVENAGWRDELTRYSLLSRDLYGAPLRRLWVVLALLAVFAYLLRPRGEDARPTLGLPAAAVGVSLLLLIVTPSKLPWHFGVLIGLAAVALAAETARLVAEPRRWHVRPFLVVAAGVVAAAWAWGPRLAWSTLDLRTLHWTLGVERHLTFAKAAGAVPVLVLLALAVFAFARRRSRRLEDVPWRAAAWIVPAVTVPLLAFTVGVFAADAAKTSSWTLARQNVDSLRGNLDCGLADDSLVPVRSSMRPVASEGSLPSAAPSLPPAPVDGLPTFALAPQATARSPWFAAPKERAGFFLTGIASPSEEVELEWRRAGGVAGAGQVAGDLGSDARPELGYWRFYTGSVLPSAPPGTGAVRFAVRASGTGGGPAVGLTPPVTYEDEPLARLIRDNEPALALPNLLPYVPCARLPEVSRGVAQVPKLIVAFRDTTWPFGAGTSPIDELPDLYRLIRLPLSDSSDPPDDVVVYVVDTRTAGTALAPAVRST
jgi:cell wall arabinan synthesis protein